MNKKVIADRLRHVLCQSQCIRTWFTETEAS